MSRSWMGQVGLVGLIGIGSWVGSAGAALAQLVPDATLGIEGSVVVPNETVRGAPADLINGGATRGGNLFHSFQEFNVLDGQRVYFANPSGIANIISRVTGGNVSNLFGTLGVNGNASLFLLNPNGVVFGPNARLDVSGSFFASAGDRFTFSDGSSFSASDPQSSLLTMSVPVGVQYGAGASSAIRNQGNLQVGQDFTLAATNLDLQGQLRAGGNLNLRAQNTLQIRDSATSPFIAAANNRLLLRGNGLVDIFALNHPDSGLFSGGDLVVRSPNSVIGDARYSSGGNFRIEQPNGNLGALVSPNDPVIRATGDVAFDSYAGASLHIFAGGSVTIPSFVWVQGADPANGIVENVDLVNGVRVDINGRIRPTLDIRAGTLAVGVPGIQGAGIFLPGLPGLGGAPTGSNITIGTIYFATDGLVPQAGDILLTNQYQPNLTLPAGAIRMSQNPALNETFLQNRAIVNGDEFGGGRVEVHARGNVALNGIINVDPSSFDGVTIAGNGGDVRIQAAGNINLGPGALINSTGVVGGNVALISDSAVRLAGQPLENVFLAGVVSFSTGNNARGLDAGDVTVRARSLSLNDGAILATSTNPFATDVVQADPGDVIINADQITLDNLSQIRANIDPGGIGQAGDVSITGRSLSLSNGAQIQSGLFRPQVTNNNLRPAGQGSGGNVILNLSDSIIVSGFSPIVGVSSGIFTIADRETVGSPGSITLTTNLLDVSEGALIAATVNNGTPRTNLENDITINANRVFLRSGGQILANTRNNADAGNMSLNVGDRLEISGRDPAYQDRIRLVQQFIDNQRASLPPQLQNFADRLEDLLPNIGDLEISNSGIYARAAVSQFIETAPASPIEGSAGNILVTAPTIEMTNSGFIDSTTFGNGNGGTVGILTQNMRLLEGSEILALTVGGSGNAEGIIILPIDPNVPSSLVISGVAPPIPGGSPRGYSSGMFASTEATATGTAGDILISIDRLQIQNGGVIGVRSRTAANAGNVIANVNTLELTGGGQILTAALRGGDAGNIVINARDGVAISGSDPTRGDRIQALINFGRTVLGLTDQQAIENAESIVDSVGSSTNPNIAPSGLQARATADNLAGGNIVVRVQNGSISLSNGSEINSQSNNDQTRDSEGNLAFSTIFLQALGGSLELDNSRITTTNGTLDEKRDGFAGDVLLTARDTIQLRNNSQISSQGNFGRIVLGEFNPNDAVFERVFLSPREISISGRSQIVTNNITAGSGSAGFIGLTALDSISLIGDLTFTSTSDRTLIDSDTFNGDSAGNVQLNAPAIALRDGALVTTTTSAAGDAGEISLRGNTISLINESAISSSTFGSGNAGRIFLTGSDSVVIDDSNIFSTVATLQDDQVRSGVGSSGGDIFVDTNQLRLVGGSQLQVLVTENQTGTAGRILLDVPGTVEFDDGVAFSTLEAGATGAGGDIFVGNLFFDDENRVISMRPSNSIVLTNGGQLIAQTSGLGDAGNIYLAGDRIRFQGSSPEGFPSAVFSGVDRGGEGRGGNIFISRNIEFRSPGLLPNNAQLLSTEVDFGIVDPNTFLPTGELILQDGGLITVSSYGNTLVSGGIRIPTGQVAGNLFIAAEQMGLLNNGRIFGETAAGQGGNITIQGIQDILLLSGGSVISTTAGTDQTDVNQNIGGNITINITQNRPGFVVGAPRRNNNDIISNSFQGPGGAISINATGIYGFVLLDPNQLRAQFGDNPLAPRQLPTNDITAFSTASPLLDGDINLDTAEADPTGRVVPLPNLAPPAQLNAQCPTTAEQARNLSQFYNTGRGGLPPSVAETPGSEGVVNRLATLEGEAGETEDDAPTTVAPAAAPLVEAQGWTVGADGTVQLVASAESAGTGVTPAASAFQPQVCGDPGIR